MSGKGISHASLERRQPSGYIGLQIPEDWIATWGIPFAQPAQARTALLEICPDWNPALTNLIRYYDEPLAPFQINMLPVEHRWENKPGVTLLGDART